MNIIPTISAPVFIVIAGPNGSGKSTFTRSTLTILGVPVIDPDMLSLHIQTNSQQGTLVEAGKRAILQARAYVAARQSFAMETTLSGHLQLRLIEEAKNNGFTIDLIFIGIELVEICVARVALRVAKGGHSVPETDVRRRYQRAMENLSKAVALADTIILYDNTTDQGHRKVLTMNHGQIIDRELPPPLWVSKWFPM